MFAVELENMDTVQEWLGEFPAAMRVAMRAKSSELAAALQAGVQQKFDGSVLQSKSGRLMGSIVNSTEETGQGIEASVFSDGDIPYAAIQEYGGVTKAHIIEASRAKALAFSMSGKQAFFVHVNHPGSVIPEHSYLRSTLSNSEGDIADGIEDCVTEVVNI